MLQTEVISIIVITVALAIVIVSSGKKLNAYTNGMKPRGVVLLCILYVQAICSLTEPVMGKKKGRMMAAYIGAVFLFILASNWSGLLNLSNPTANFSVTLSLALITWIWIQAAKMKTNGLKGYFSDFFKPFFFFAIPNFFGTIAPLISLSLRIFGNVLSGSIIMTLLYSFTAWTSSYIPAIGGFDFFGVVIAPWLHIYFDIFSGFIQAFLFISLSTIFIGIEYEEVS